MATAPTRPRAQRRREARKKQLVKPRQIALLGYAEETRDLIFNLGEDVELWGINAAHYFTFKQKEGKWLLRQQLTVKPVYWFQIHPKDWSSLGNKPTGYFGRPKEHLDFLQQFPGTVWMKDQPTIDEMGVPNGKPYPLEKILSLAGREYITSSFAFQLALVWYQHVHEKNPVGTVYCYGINLTSLDEYSHQKPCVEYWIGRLEEAGVKVVVPDGSALMKGSIYGREAEDMSKHAFERLQARKKDYTTQRDNHLVGQAIALDTQFWVDVLNTLYQKLMDKYPEMNLKDDEEITSMVQGVVQRREQWASQMEQGALTGALSATGELKEAQHWLSLMGAFDYRANGLPEIIKLSPNLATEQVPPQHQSI